MDALARAGLREVCVAPGSRSTPLALAFARQSQISVHSHLDERSAAYFALGMALAQDAPVVLLCTSGTAAANLFPAIVEANLARVPLLVITADRPPELRHSGANQTIDQVKIYGDHVLWSVDCAAPEARPSSLALRNLCTLAARGMALANGLRKGVVHVNMAFRKPFEPDAEDDEADRDAPPLIVATSPPALVSQPDDESMGRLRTLVRDKANGLIVCGPGCGREFPAQVVRAFAERAGWPLIADPVSGLRYRDAEVVACADTILSARPDYAPRPDVVLRLGAVPTSTALNQWLDRVRPPHQIQLAPSGVWADDSHRTTCFMQAGPATLEAAGAGLARQPDSAVAGNWWREAETLTRQFLRRSLLQGDWFDGAAVAEMLQHLPDGAALFAGNSLPVRLLDQFGMPTGRNLRALANRGASGIDGNISTALGVAQAQPERPLFALVGDVTFYHDMNGLLALRRLGIDATIILLNNNGGGIFRRLPVREHEPHFTDLFLTPHNLDFSHAARLYGAEHVVADDRESFRRALAQRADGGGSRIIELRTDSLEDLQRREANIEAVGRVLDGLFTKSQ